MAGGESKRSRRYDKENLLWQSTVAIKSDPVGSEAEVLVLAAKINAFRSMPSPDPFVPRHHMKQGGAAPAESRNLSLVFLV